MIFATTDTIAGYQAVPLGLVLDTQTVGLHLGRDILLKLTDFFGGRSHVIDRQSQEALQKAAERLEERAKALGATGVLAVRMMVQPIGVKRTAMVQAVIYGTAVRLEPVSGEAARLETQPRAVGTRHER
jgi:uncharacterized protein YbjQ (UPF0145 family)